MTGARKGANGSANEKPGKSGVREPSQAQRWESAQARKPATPSGTLRISPWYRYAAPYRRVNPPPYGLLMSESVYLRSEGWGFESLRARPAQRPIAIL